MINGDVRTQGNIRVSELNDSGVIVCGSISDCHHLQANRIECSGDIHTASLVCEQITYKK